MSARPVRIPRTVAPPVRPVPAAAPIGRFVENTAGTIRARRLFLLFGLSIVVLYAILLGEALVSTPGLSSDPVALAILTGAAVLALPAGASVTIARAPRGVWWSAEEMVVRERFTAPRRYPRTVPSYVARRYAAGLLAPAPTEIVELAPLAGRRMTYLVSEGLLRPDAPAAGNSLE